ncbi:MAG: DUF2334 domain-containing protein [Gemmatimonadota bacterium]
MSRPLDIVRPFLPDGKKAAVCFTIDDVHPARSSQHYDAGGDLAEGALGLIERLLRRHVQLKVTLFTTADWREISPSPSRRLVRRIPYVRDRVYLSPILPVGSRAIDRHPEFVQYVNELPRTEVALHGLHHVHHGERIHVEFQNQDTVECERMLREALTTFDRAGLSYLKGFSPPGWDAPEGLVRALQRLGFLYLASARDIRTPVSDSARADMSGLGGMSLIYPTHLGEGLFHFTTNFQATSDLERACRILDNGGLLAIKAHIIKNALGHVALDGVDALYCNYLDLLFSELDRRYGCELWWTTMGGIARQLRDEVS